MQDLTLAHGNIGIERETLRTNPDATLASTPHPAALGSAYTHPNITTDYAEALLELVTNPHPTPDAAYAQLLTLHRYCAQNIGAESLWPGSMPCILPENSDDIAIGYYGTSNGGKMRRLYREGLGHRYGKTMQMIAGIHYNYSPPAALWAQLAYSGNVLSWIPLVIAAAGLIGSLLMGRSGNEGRAFALHFVGIAFAVVFIFAAMAPNVMRSSVDPAYSLTIQQAASADTTLLIMSVAAAVFVPGVLAYTIWSYKVFASRISVESINPDQGGLHPTLVRDSTQPEAHFGY